MKYFCLFFLFAVAYGLDSKAVQNYFQKSLVKGHIDFALDMQKALLDSNEENVVFSPKSLSGALAMTWLGSRGKTFNELAKMLHYDTNLAVNKYSELVHKALGGLLLQKRPNSSYDLKCSNGIFVQNDYKLRQKYVEAVEKYYNATLEYLDFPGNPSEATNVINSWVNENTNGKITDLVDEDSVFDAQVVLASALYFRASWEHQFDERATKTALFYEESNKPVEVMMMKSDGKFMTNFDDDLQVSLIGIPYQDEEATMYILQPNKAGKESLKSLAKALTFEKLRKLISGAEKADWQLHIPRMNLTSDIPVKDALKSLGVNSLFNDNADLSVLAEDERTSWGANYEVDVDKVHNEAEYFYKQYVDNVVKSKNTDGIDRLRNEGHLANPGLRVKDIRHKVTLLINEEGTEGAAATSLSLTNKMLFAYEKLYVNKPFMFFVLQHDSQMILFSGLLYKV